MKIKSVTVIEPLFSMKIEDTLFSYLFAMFATPFFLLCFFILYFCTIWLFAVILGFFWSWSDMWRYVAIAVVSEASLVDCYFMIVWMTNWVFCSSLMLFVCDYVEIFCGIALCVVALNEKYEGVTYLKFEKMVLDEYIVIFINF